jgi:glycosyltransferase involved in cell wall biosynthesis
MAKWAEELPIVTVPMGNPKSVTLVVPYYNAPIFLAEQITRWQTVPDELWPYLSLIVVDDGSRLPAQTFSLPFRSRLFRIDVDVAWNWLAARNIGAHHADTPWLLLTDIDHVVPHDTLRACVFGQHSEQSIYGFSRREHTGNVIHSHSASFLMARSLFWQIGGYDEALSGVYGTDGAFRKRCEQHAKFKILTDEIIRYEFVHDSSVDLPRKTPEMREARRKRFAAVGVNPVPKTLSFPYHQVTA